MSQAGKATFRPYPREPREPVEWDLRVTIYANGRRVGSCDVFGDTLEQASWNLGTELATGRVQKVTRHGRKMLDPSGRSGAA